MIFEPVLTAEEAPKFDPSVVPTYLSFFSAHAIELLLPFSPARVAHIGCRTGYPDGMIADKLPGAKVVGVDASEAALQVARSRAELLNSGTLEYERCEGLPTPLEAGTFTHTFSLCPILTPEERALFFAEHRRLLLPGGQCVLSMPIRGSFPELSDMLREYALRSDLTDLGTAVDAAWQARPTIETLAEELENASFTDVDVDVQLLVVSYANGREFVEDLATRLFVLPDLCSSLPFPSGSREPALEYLADAVSKYWSDGVLELTVNVGCVSALKYA